MFSILREIISDTYTPVPFSFSDEYSQLYQVVSKDLQTQFKLGDLADIIGTPTYEQDDPTGPAKAFIDLSPFMRLSSPVIFVLRLVTL